MLCITMAHRMVIDYMRVGTGRETPNCFFNYVVAFYYFFLEIRFYFSGLQFVPSNVHVSWCIFVFLIFFLCKRLTYAACQASTVDILCD